MNTTFPKTIQELPSPKGQFLLGHVTEFKNLESHIALENWIEACGELFKINFLGTEFIVSANPTFNAEVLKRRPETFRRLSKMDEIFKELGIFGVFNAEGEDWKRHRKVTAEALNVQKVKGFFPILMHKTESILQKFKRYAQRQQTIAVHQEAMKFTIDLTTAIAFGYELDTIHDKANDFQKHLELIFPMISHRITAPIPLWRYIKQKKDKQLDLALAYIEKVIHQCIDEAKLRIEKQPELKENPSNFLEALLTEKAGVCFSDQEIYSNIFTMLLAGEDTTANSIAWTLFYLAQYPEQVQKIRKEAMTVYPDTDTPTAATMLSQLPYAHAVAQEAIRLKSTVPQFYVEANTEVTIEGLTIPKGTKLMIQTRHAQRQEKYFTNAEHFIPERWLAQGCPAHQHHTPAVINAFGSGPRFCPGMHLAMQEIVILISSLCKQFDFQLDIPSETVQEKFAFTMFPDPLKLKVQELKSVQKKEC